MTLIHKSETRSGWLEKAWNAADIASHSRPRKAAAMAEVMRQCLAAAKLSLPKENT